MRLQTTLLQLLFFFISVNGNAIVIKTGINNANQHEQQQDGGVYDTSAKKGVSNFEAEQGFNLENDRKYVKAEDGGNYAEENANKNHHLDESDYAGEKFHDQGGGTVVDLGNQVAHKKGHHRSGFHNSYHKDESGSNSSFYDDGDDVGDQRVFKTHKGTYGDIEKQRNHGSHLEGKDYAKEEGRRGGYNNGGVYEKDLGNKRDYNQKQYYDDHTLAGRSNAGHRYAEAARDQEEKYHSRPFIGPHRPHHPYPHGEYYGSHAYRAPIQKTITIYEDPREDYARGYEPQYASDDYIQLDVKRSPAYYDYRSYDQKPYDDYYY